MNLFNAIQALDDKQVRKLLDESNDSKICDDLGRTFLHVAIGVSNNTEQKVCTTFPSDPKSRIIYMLIDSGIDLEAKDNAGNTCLWLSVSQNDIKSSVILLQCGADMHSICPTGNSIFNEVIESYDENVTLKEMFKKYHPGLWNAVECGDIYQVRRLTNFWCKTNLMKDSKTIKELAIEVAHEEIITFIYGIHDTMKLIHHVLARNTRAVEAMLQKSQKTIRLDIRNMSNQGAPILYYLIQWEDIEMIKLFVSYGCHVYTVMRDEHGFDMPVLFSSLYPNISLEVIEALLPNNKPHQEEMLYKLLYRGMTVLEASLKNCVNLSVFNLLVDRGGPLVIIDRNQFNQSVRDIAFDKEMLEYAAVIDRNVTYWITQPDLYPGRRQALALYGWDHISDFPSSSNLLAESEDGLKFLDHLGAYQKQIKKLVWATEKGYLKEFKRLRIFSSEETFFHNVLSWDGRSRGDGLPLLHRAVLFNRPLIVEAILNDKPDNQSIDTLFDQCHRTALHYAYASQYSIEVKNMLLDNGCSEHVLDRNNKEPLDFKDKQGSPLMAALLQRTRLKQYNVPEPDPWSTIQNTSFPHQCYISVQDCYCMNHNYASDENEDPNDDENCDMIENEYYENDTESEPESSHRQCCIM